MCETCEAFMNDDKPSATFRCPALGTRIDDWLCKGWRKRYHGGCMDGNSSFRCAALGGIQIKARYCREERARRENQHACINCLIPLAEKDLTPHPRPLPVRGEGAKDRRDSGNDCMSCPAAPGYGACEHCGTRPLCKKCGRPFSVQEAQSGFTTCEYCGKGDAA